MIQWEFPGACWWRFDFHTHTPASDDFMKGSAQKDIDEITPERWLQRFMEAGVHCVAITDHNSGSWIDILKETLEKLASSKRKPVWYRPLYLFPGVEITTNDEVHVLAIFGSDKSKSDIDGLLGKVECQGGSNAISTQSTDAIVDEIAKRGGIAIPAHIDRAKGLLQLPPRRLERILRNENVFAWEVCDDHCQDLPFAKNPIMQPTQVRGSDTHFKDLVPHKCLEDRIGTFSWVKMDKPSIEGLRLALIDGTASVNRDMNAHPNHHADFFIKELVIDQAKYIGRSHSLGCRFSPFLTTIIGGRGSGKSTLLEFMRLVLRREEEILPSLKEEGKKYFNVGNENLLVENSQISLIYCKGDVRYRLNWSAKGVKPSIEERRNSEWVSIPGEIRSLFPAYIYSQKQIFELARDPSALLDIIDEAPDVDYASFEKQRRDLESRYKLIEQKIQELNESIEQENRLRGEHNDLARQIEQIERSGHKQVLQNYRERQQQKMKSRV